MAKYKLIPFTTATLAAAKSKWEDIAGKDGFDLEFAAVFEWASTHLNQQSGDSMAYCLHNNDNGNADGIVEIVTSRMGALSKLLKIVPSPEFWDVNNKRVEILQIYRETFFGLITQKEINSARTVKIYGRDDEMMSILRSIHAVWNIPDSTAEFEGRFLTISLG